MTPAIAADQARALGAPTRRAILTYLEGAARPVGVAELTDHLDLNHNAVRKHLAKLVGAGLVDEQTEPRQARGRPRLLYTLTPGLGAEHDSYERLAVLLATVLATGDDPVTVGRQAAVATSAHPAGDPVAALAGRLAQEGFAPRLEPGEGGEAALVLGHCPYAAAAEANPDAVCRLHLGLAQGLAETIGSIRVDSLHAASPRTAGCRLRVFT